MKVSKQSVVLDNFFGNIKVPATKKPVEVDFVDMGDFLNFGIKCKGKK